jgi:hypothetical protein
LNSVDGTCEKKSIAAQAREREARFKRLLSIAERNWDAPPGQVEDDVAEAVMAVRGEE